MAADIFQQLGDLHAALHEVETAELFAAELRDEHTLREVYLRLGMVAARSGRQSLVLDAFHKLFAHHSGSPLALKASLRLIWQLDGAGEAHAAGIAWTALRKVAEEQGGVTGLYTYAARRLFETLVKQRAIHDVTLWKAWLSEHLPADAVELMRGRLDVINDSGS